jgi:hypothetical protein
MEHVTFSYFLLRCVSWKGKEKTSQALVILSSVLFNSMLNNSSYVFSER